LASLQEYVLVDIPPRRVEIFRRAPKNEWLFHEYLPGDEHCSFKSLDTSVPFDELFDDLVPNASTGDGAQRTDGA